MKFHWMKVVGFGVLLWIILFIVIAALVGMHLHTYIWAQLLVTCFAGIVAYLLAGNNEISTTRQAIQIGVSWTILIALLDGFITKILNPAIFEQWSTLLTYLLVFAAPWIAWDMHKTPEKRQSHAI